MSAPERAEDAPLTEAERRADERQGDYIDYERRRREQADSSH